MNKSYVLVPNDLDLVNKTKATELVAELLLCHTLIQAAKVDIPACITLADSKSNLGGHRGWLSPSNLQLLAVQ